MVNLFAFLAARLNPIRTPSAPGHDASSSLGHVPYNRHNHENITDFDVSDNYHVNASQNERNHGDLTESDDAPHRHGHISHNTHHHGDFTDSDDIGTYNDDEEYTEYSDYGDMSPLTIIDTVSDILCARCMRHRDFDCIRRHCDWP